MTEDEAKTKWCPFVRYASRNGMAINRWINEEDRQLSPEPARCIASACMAWRQTSLTTETATHYAGAPPSAEEGWTAVGPAWDGDPNNLLKREGGSVLQRFERHPAISGFCGLAGAPQ